MTGNSAVAFGGNEENGSYAVGIGADVYQKYRFDLKYVDFFGATKNGTYDCRAKRLQHPAQGPWPYRRYLQDNILNPRRP